MSVFDCRPRCAACCIAPSITSPLPGMPNGKPVGVACVQLDDELSCKVFGQPQRPAFCGGLQPSAEMCGASREEAMVWLSRLEQATQPVPADSSLLK
ncbi:MAG: YkgJ family cysteine cluster protein [Nitrosomonadales bacterium]|nr:YkgJ family cysteine cluster protein [Nitrosomonadales bacterium]